MQRPVVGERDSGCDQSAREDDGCCLLVHGRSGFKLDNRSHRVTDSRGGLGHVCLPTIAVADLSQAANREFLPNRSLQARSGTRSGCFRSELSPVRRFRVPDANGRSQYPAKASACLAGVALAPRSSKCVDLSAGDFYSKRFLTCSLLHMTATIPVIGVLGLLQCRSCRSGPSCSSAGLGGSLPVMRDRQSTRPNPRPHEPPLILFPRGRPSPRLLACPVARVLSPLAAAIPLIVHNHPGRDAGDDDQ